MTHRTDAGSVDRVGSGSATHYPPSVIRGVQLHAPQGAGGREGGGLVERVPETGVHPGIDWLRVKLDDPAGGDEAAAEFARALLADWWGDVPERAPGLFSYRGGWRYACGVRVMVGHDDGSVLVDIPGSALSDLSPDERVRLLRAFLACGYRPTRIDVAHDFVRQGLRIVERCWEDRAAVCHTRNVNRVVGFSLSAGVVGQTVYLGKRGRNGSGRYGRAYDKGLESGASRTLGEWERFEVEFVGDCAVKVAQVLARSDDWRADARRVAFGSFDFRAVSGGASRSLARRPRLEGWARVVAVAETLLVRATRRYSSLPGLASWVRVSVAPILERLAVAAGVGLVEVFRDLAGDVEPSRSASALLRGLEYRRHRSGA